MERKRGYAMALHARGVTLDEVLVAWGAWSKQFGMRATEALLALDDPPTAIVAAGNMHAEGVLEIAGEAQMEVPGDLAIVSFGTTPSLFSFLTAAASPASEMGRAAAEMLHERARSECGFGREENLSKEDLIRERYRGIRPAPGYPACPDHTEKTVLWDLLEVERHTGIQLTESYAMSPSASVCGLYFAHPEARYFAVGAVGRDQVEAYASRKGISVREAERWLSPNLGYEPER